MEDAFDEVIGMENINIIVFGGSESAYVITAPQSYGGLDSEGHSTKGFA
ncbi:hypothetical protein ACETU7_24710 [Rhodococcus sp. 3Y1]